MRKISRDAAQAFKDNVNFHRDNTQVVVLKNKTLFYLFGNLIAIKKDLTDATVHWSDKRGNRK